MDSSERDAFSSFERQPYVDLKEWGMVLHEYVQARIRVVEEELHKYLGASLSPAVHESVMNRVLTQLVNARAELIEPEVDLGDPMFVRGGIIYDMSSEGSEELQFGLLGAESELKGRFDSLAVKDYVEEGLLDIPPELLTDEVTVAHTRRYGVHLVLVDPIEVLPDGTECIIAGDMVFIPLMYQRLSLGGYLAWKE